MSQARRSPVGLQQLKTARKPLAIFWTSTDGLSALFKEPEADKQRKLCTEDLFLGGVDLVGSFETFGGKVTNGYIRC